MEWIVKIDGKTNQRIRVTFDPIEVSLFLQGEYKPKNQEWIVFDIKKIKYTEHLSYDIDDEVTDVFTKEILTIAEDLNKELNRKIKIYEMLTKIITPMKENSLEFLDED